MSAEIVDFISRYMPVSEALADIFRKSQFVQEFSKGTVLLRQGEVAHKAYFVLKGCIRSYILKDGEDKTLDFSLEEEPALPIGLGQGLPSTHYLECLEDTVAVVSSPEEEKLMLAEYPELKAVCLTLAELMAEKLRESLARYRSSTPEERYRQLVERRPDLLQRIPQYHVASYLGVKPESLSRIRRRLSRLKENDTDSLRS